MSKCVNPACRKKIQIQIRKGSDSCSLDCDRVLGIGKYFVERVEEEKKARKKK